MKKTKDVTNVDVAVYALATLGGVERTIYSEDIAAKCYELSPSQFGWCKKIYRKHRWPDKEVVRIALMDARKEKHGSLVEGEYAREQSKDGWRLTSKGASWFKQNATRIGKHLDSETRSTAFSVLDSKRFLKQIRSQPLYKIFSKSKNLTNRTSYEFTDMLNCSPDASEEVILAKYSRLCSTAELVGDEEIISFLENCKRTFLRAAEQS